MLYHAQRWLTERMATDDETSLDLDRTLGDFAACWSLVEIIDEILGDEKYIAEVCSRSYIHDNGFDRLELFSSTEPEYALRLHIWWKNATKRNERIHGHPWSFASLVLKGLIRFEQFVETPSGEPVEVFHYKRPTAQGTYTLLPAGTTRIRAILRGGISSGLVYSAHHEMLHRVWGDSERDTMTLMLHGPSISYPSRVFGSRNVGHVKSERHTQPHPDAESLRRKLHCAKALLGA